MKKTISSANVIGVLKIDGGKIVTAGAVGYKVCQLNEFKDKSPESAKRLNNKLADKTSVTSENG